MDPNKLKRGDFLTWASDEGIAVGRIISFERYEFPRDPKLNGKVCAAKVLVFPNFNFDGIGNEHFRRISKFYLEQAVYSSEAEITAWMRTAMEYEDELRASADEVRQCFNIKIAKKKIVRMDDINKYEDMRLPPKHYYNWLWGVLKRCKLFDPKKHQVLLFGDRIWTYKPSNKKE